MANSKTLIRDFTSGSVAKKLIVFAAPLFLSNMLQVVYNMVDMVIVGQVTGDVGISAVSVGGDIAHFLVFLAMGFSNAGQVIIAQYIGAGQRNKLGRFIGTMFMFLFTCAIVLSAACLLLRNQILQIMSTPAAAWDGAMVYSCTCMVGLAFTYGYNMVSAVLRGMGDSRHPFLFISIAAVLNIILDVLFVMVFRWGPFGAALATVIGQAVSFISAAVFLVRRRAQFGFEISRADFRIHGDMLSGLLRLGVPMAILSASVQFSKLFVNSWINSYGVIVSAVSGVGNKLNLIGNQISNAMNTAGASMIGQNVGAKKYDRVTRIVLTVLAINSSLALVMIAALLLFPAQIFGIFGSTDAMLAVAMTFLPIGVLNLCSSALRSGANSFIHGTGSSHINFLTAILDGLLLRIGLSLLFGLVLRMEYFGFWLGDAVASFTPFPIGLIYFLSGRWKTRNAISEGKKADDGEPA